MVTYDQFNASLLKNKTIWMVEGKKTIQYLFQNIKINDINIYSAARNNFLCFCIIMTS